MFRLTISDVQGLATADAPTTAAAAYAGGGEAPVAVPKVKLEVAVNEDFVEPTVRAIARAGRSASGERGDGKVLVLPLEEAIRIRTGERGPEAI